MQNDIHRFLRQESGDDVFFFDNAKSQISALQKMIDEVPSPELIDEGQHAAPSKRILTQFPDYSKVTTGPQVAEQVGLENIRSRCPHFNAWLERLEKLATDAA